MKSAMGVWITFRAMRRLGFRRVSSRYWLCRDRHGLPPDAHLTVTDHDDRDPVDLSAFHVTFEVLDERVHFYYREEEPGVWSPEGHTPIADLRRLGVCRAAARRDADAIAARLVAALHARWMPESIDGDGYRAGE